MKRAGPQNPAATEAWSAFIRYLQRCEDADIGGNAFDKKRRDFCATESRFAAGAMRREILRSNRDGQNVNFSERAMSGFFRAYLFEKLFVHAGRMKAHFPRRAGR
jgi:hypothetical protein